MLPEDFRLFSFSFADRVAVSSADFLRATLDLEALLGNQISQLFSPRLLDQRSILDRTILTRSEVLYDLVVQPRVLVMVDPLESVKSPTPLTLRPDGFDG